LAFAQFGEGHPEFEFEALINDKVVIACLRSHPLAKANSTTWEEVKDEQFEPFA
jgi:DNA-binding transcriptional LysR family regulator